MAALGAIGRLTCSVVLIALSACDEPASRPEERDGGSSISYIGAWRLIEGSGPDGRIPLIDGYRITLNLQETSLVGTAACNTYASDVAIDGNAFRMESGSVTEMGCRQDVTESERAYLEALREVDSIARSGDTLTLTGDATELRYASLSPSRQPTSSTHDGDSTR